MNILLSLGRWAVANDWARALILKWLRHALTAAGTALLTYLIAHHADPASAQSLVAYLSGAAMSAIGVMASMYDAKAVDGQIKTAGADAVKAALSEKTETAALNEAQLVKGCGNVGQ